MTKAGSSSLLNAYYGELYYSVALVSRRTDRRESRRRTTFPIKSTLPHQRANKCQEEPLPNPSILPTESLYHGDLLIHSQQQQL